MKHTHIQREPKIMTGSWFGIYILLYCFRLLPIISLVGGIYFINKYISDITYWKTNDDASADEKTRRSSGRGTFTSTISAIILSIVAAILAAIGCDESHIVVNFGFILAPVFGYMLDQGYGMDEGLRAFKKSFLEGIKHVLESLCNAKFLRYIITVALDLFISNPLQDILKSQFIKNGLTKILGKSKGIIGIWDDLILLNFPSLLQAIVTLVTFQAYTNQTRFYWAYPDKSIPRDRRISSGTMMITSCIAGVVYLSFYKMMDYIFKRKYYQVNVKLTYVMISIAIIFWLNIFRKIEAPIDSDPDSTDEILPNNALNSKYLIGLCLVIIFFSYGLLYPIYNALMK